MRILLFGDHRYRDVPALANLALKLRDAIQPVDVQIVSFDLWQIAVETFLPHVVVLNHLMGKRNQIIAETVRRNGGLVVVMPTEGRPNTYDQIKWAEDEFPHQLCDLYLAWSEHIKPPVPTVVTGSPRFDFYTMPLLKYLPDRQITKGKYGIEQDRKVITVATSYPQAKFAVQGGSFNTQDWKDLKVTTIPGREDPAVFAQKEYDERKAFSSWLRAVRSSYPEYAFVLKPHPAEDVYEWSTFCDDNNIILRHSDYIWSLLAVSDFHIVRADCMTMSEAWYLGIETLAVTTGEQIPGPGTDATDLSLKCKPTLDGAQDAVVFMQMVIGAGIRIEREFGERLAYNKKWLSPTMDATTATINAITQLIVSKPPEVRDINIQAKTLLSRALAEHQARNSGQIVDFAGQVNKAVRISDVQSWFQQLEAR